MTRDHIVREIIRTAKENGDIPLGSQKFATETGIKKSYWRKFWGTKWNDALKEAGYDAPNKFSQPYDDEFLILKLIDIIREIHRFPTDGDLRVKANKDKPFPSSSTFRRLGLKQDVSKKIVEYCEKHGQLSDVLDICCPILSSIKEKNESEIDEQENDVEKFGFVYLMKAGKYYKIGRSNSAYRREYELKIQLPQKAELIHQIKTDDPIGIEAYWHNRYKEKRANGEWFELASADVKAFKRRKFM